MSGSRFSPRGPQSCPLFACLAAGVLLTGLGCGTQPGGTQTGGPSAGGGNTKTFVNAKEGLTGKLSDHYVDFTFNYPAGWKLKPADGENFVKVERAVTGAEKDGSFTQENFAVGTFWSDAPPGREAQLLPMLAEDLSRDLADGFPNYKQIAIEPTTVAGYQGHELRFSAQVLGTPKGDITFWGRCVLIPDPKGGRDGVTIVMLATNLAEGVASDKDVGVKGELPVILNSFKLGK